jgi:hypothetical protein
MDPMRGFLTVLLAAAMAGAGCQSCDLVEAELRTRERQLRETREELDRTEAYNEALQNEVKDLRQSPSNKISPEQASQIYTLKGIGLGRQTGGYDEDSVPGDEALQVVLEPRDPDGHAIKAPGSLHVIALEVSSEGLKMPLSSWDVGPDQLRRTWRNGLLSTGYYVVLPWKKWPSSNRLRVVAQFTLTDGRVFEAEKDVTIRLVPNAYRQPPFKMQPADPIILDPGDMDLAAPPARVIPEAQGHSRKAKGVEAVSTWKASPSPAISQPIQLLRPTRE